jgi:hypothetical protein
MLTAAISALICSWEGTYCTLPQLCQDAALASAEVKSWLSPQVLSYFAMIGLAKQEIPAVTEN